MAESSTSNNLISVHEEMVKLPKLKGSSISTIQKRSSTFTLVLKPHNNHFQTRTLELKDKIKIRIGRQTSQKTSPTAFNGFFDSKVLSRQHAEVWSDKSRVYIKDVKSSNGTFVNGQRLSNEGEESEPMELKDEDEIEFGIDIINDNGSVMYHKVACTVHIFPVPLSQVDDSILKDISNQNPVQVYPDPHLPRKISTSSTGTLSSTTTVPELAYSSSTPALSATAIVNGTGTGEGIVTGAGNKKSKKLESILAKLHIEMEKSKQVESELRSIKETVVDLDKVFSLDDNMKKSDELQFKLNQAEVRIKSFDEKWKCQNQAIHTAKTELHKLERQVANYNGWKLEKEKLAKDLLFQREKTKELETQVQKLLLEAEAKTEQKRKGSSSSSKSSGSNSFIDAFQIKSIQVLFTVLIGVISTLFYILYK